MDIIWDCTDFENLIHDDFKGTGIYFCFRNFDSNWNSREKLGERARYQWTDNDIHFGEICQEQHSDSNYEPFKIYAIICFAEILSPAPMTRQTHPEPQCQARVHWYRYIRFIVYMRVTYLSAHHSLYSCTHWLSLRLPDLVESQTTVLHVSDKRRLRQAMFSVRCLSVTIVAQLSACIFLKVRLSVRLPASFLSLVLVEKVFEIVEFRCGCSM